MKAQATIRTSTKGVGRGFTLVELLVVIVIVVVLAGLGFMGGKRAIDAAHNAECVSNLRGLANAGQLYASEHLAYPNQGRQMDGSHTWWFEAMEEELGFKPGTSPSIIERADIMPTCKKCLKSHPGADPINDFVRTYSMNERLLSPAMNGDGQWAYPGLRTSQVKFPSRTAFFMDGAVAGKQHYWQYLTRRGEWLKPENFIHGDRANVAFIDGHVEALRLEEVPTNAAHSFWYPQAKDPSAPKHR